MGVRTYLVDGSGELHVDLPIAEVVTRSRDPKSFAWIDFEDPAEEDLLALAEIVGLHDLTLEALLADEARARIEEFDDHLFVVMKALNFNEGVERLHALNLNVLLHKDFLVTAHRLPVRSIAHLEEELKRRTRALKDGPAFLFHSLADRVMGWYAEVLGEIDGSIAELERRILEGDRGEVVREIFAWKRDLVRLKRRTAAHRELFTRLCTTPHKLLPKRLQVYLRDVLQEVIRLDERMSSYRDLLMGATELHMALEANRANEVMKTLSIVATVVLPMNIVTGLYGTNFTVLPGAAFPHAFWIFLASLALMGGTTTLYFRRRGWL